jgi:capsular exopolysaccharide synthesis family protein
MGKILNALKTAKGDIPDLVLRCLEDYSPDAPFDGLVDSRDPISRRQGSTAVVEPIFDRSPVLHLPQRVRTIPRPGEGHAERVTREVSFWVSDSSPLLSPKNDDRRSAEQYRVIRTRIFHHVPGASVTVVSSPGMGDGKTVTALNLAAALALKSEDRVILVDADLRLSKVHERLGLPASPGLAEVLAGKCALEDAMVRVEQLPNFYVLLAGEAESNPSELFDSSRWPALVGRLREEFQRTIVDSPPVEAVADYDLIASVCDGLVLVVRPNHTSRTALNSALAKVKGKLTGVLINGAEDWFLWRNKSSDYYYYQRGEAGRAGRKAAR